MADGRAQDPRVLDLADRIEADQDPEIQTMTGWLEDWDQPTSADESGGMDMEGGMGGMVPGLPSIPGMPHIPGLTDLPGMPATAGAPSHGNGSSPPAASRDEWDF